MLGQLAATTNVAAVSSGEFYCTLTEESRIMVEEAGKDAVPVILECMKRNVVQVTCLQQQQQETRKELHRFEQRMFDKRVTLYALWHKGHNVYYVCDMYAKKSHVPLSTRLQFCNAVLDSGYVYDPVLCRNSPRVAMLNMRVVAPTAAEETVVNALPISSKLALP